MPLKTHLVFVTYISTIKNSKSTLHAGFGLPLKPKNIGRYFILHFSPSFHLPIANFFKKTSSKRRTCRPIQVIPQSNVAEKYCRRNMHALFWCYCLIEDWTWGRDVFPDFLQLLHILIRNINFVCIFFPILGGSPLYPKTFLRYVTNISNLF